MKSRILMRGKKRWRPTIVCLRNLIKSKEKKFTQILENKNVFSFFLKVSNDFCFPRFNVQSVPNPGSRRTECTGSDDCPGSWFLQKTCTGRSEISNKHSFGQQFAEVWRRWAVPTSKDQRSNLETDTLCYRKPMQLSQKWHSRRSECFVQNNPGKAVLNQRYIYIFKTDVSLWPWF